MLKNREQKFLTPKKQKTIVAITVIISFALLVVLYTSMGIFTREVLNNQEKLIGLVFIMLFIPIMMGFLAYNMVGLDKTKLLEGQEKLSKYIKENLSSDCFRQVYLYYNQNSSREEMIEKILKEGEYQFSAMLLADGTIILGVKDKDGKTVYMTNIKNYYYFVNNFTFKEGEQYNG